MHTKHEVTDLGVGEEHNEEHDREGHDVSETLESKHFKYPSLLIALCYSYPLDGSGELRHGLVERDVLEDLDPTDVHGEGGGILRKKESEFRGRVRFPGLIRGLNSHLEGLGPGFEVREIGEQFRLSQERLEENGDLVVEVHVESQSGDGYLGNKRLGPFEHGIFEV